MSLGHLLKKLILTTSVQLILLWQFTSCLSVCPSVCYTVTRSMDWIVMDFTNYMGRIVWSVDKHVFHNYIIKCMLDILLLLLWPPFLLLLFTLMCTRYASTCCMRYYFLLLCDNDDMHVIISKMVCIAACQFLGGSLPHTVTPADIWVLHTCHVSVTTCMMSLWKKKRM